MLTHHDVTIPNAAEVFEDVKNTGLRFVGCKDIGLSEKELQDLFSQIRKSGMTSFLEVVCNNEKDHFAGIDKAIQIEADYIIGGMPRFARKTFEYLKEKKADPKFFPYVGQVVGHPCLLKGDIDTIVNDELNLQKMGVDGINLLLYRFAGDVTKLLDQTVEALKISLIVAGDIDSFERIEPLTRRKVFAFTIGGAVFERKFVPEKGIRDQVVAVLNWIS
jgi:hypothetical protein